MAKLEILEFPDDRLRLQAQPVAEVTAETRQLVDDMFETMYAAPGIGLAASQVDVQQRIVVMDISEDGDQPRVFINPEIVSAQGELEWEEGCLSVPDNYELVQRAEQVRVKALDKQGQPFELDAEGLLAVCIQHEIDHLDGKLFVDYLSAMKRDRIRKKALKQQKQRAA